MSILILHSLFFSEEENVRHKPFMQSQNVTQTNNNQIQNKNNQIQKINFLLKIKTDALNKKN